MLLATPVFEMLWKAMKRPDDWDIVQAYPDERLPHLGAYHRTSKTLWLISHGFVFELQGGNDTLREHERWLLSWKMGRIAKLKEKTFFAEEMARARAVDEKDRTALLKTFGIRRPHLRVVK
jgi:hypothetical protein